MSRPLSGESVFRALAHPTRRNIILALRRDGESAAGKILPNELTSKAALTDHLRALQHAGLISFRRKGTRLMYRLHRASLKPIEQFLATVHGDR